MKKIGIITIVNVENFGAELQAFATQRKIELLGYESEIIDYPFYKDPRHKKTKESRPLFNMPLKTRVIEWVFPKVSIIKRLFKNSHSVSIRKKKFLEFHKKNTKFSRLYPSILSLYKSNMDYDVYIVGSDQVWNPNNYTSLKPYFLDFAPCGRRRISYASSIGVTEIPAYAKDCYYGALNKLDAISVREKSAVRTVKKVSGRDALWVLDPTMLLSPVDWRAVENEVSGIKDDYLLIYDPTPFDYLQELAKYIAREKGLKIVRISNGNNIGGSNNDIRTLTDVGPAEFVWLFDHARFVVTNSFHGTAFSINFNKSFYVVLLGYKSNSSRQKDVLDLFGLNHRLLKEGDSFPKIDELDVDFNPVNAIMQKMRISSESFLKTNIDAE